MKIRYNQDFQRSILQPAWLASDHTGKATVFVRCYGHIDVIYSLRSPKKVAAHTSFASSSSCHLSDSHPFQSLTYIVFKAFQEPLIVFPVWRSRQVLQLWLMHPNGPVQQGVLLILEPIYFLQWRCWKKLPQTVLGISYCNSAEGHVEAYRHIVKVSVIYDFIAIYNIQTKTQLYSLAHLTKKIKEQRVKHQHFNM